jgi:hypothetical protein
MKPFLKIRQADTQTHASVNKHMGKFLKYLFDTFHFHKVALGTHLF